jgi:phosphoesterase RecJ-like protein
MFESIYKKIVEYDTIVIARHIGVDPDALCSQLALRDAIKLSFPEKKVIAIGSGSAKFSSIGKLDKLEKVNNALLIVTDTPDIKRIDIPNFSDYKEVCKIDHHPYIDTFGENEIIDTSASSASEIVLDFIKHNNMYMDEEIAKCLFWGIISDTNRFLFNTNANTLRTVADLIETYSLDVENLYKELLKRPLSEIRLQGYISTNMKVTPNGFGYVIITDDVIKEYGVDVSSAGNMVNGFNNIEEVMVWTMITEDVKNGLFKFNIRSRGPRINTIAENYNGGGHKLASGARVYSMDEANMLIHDLDEACREYLEEEGIEDEVGQC